MVLTFQTLMKFMKFLKIMISQKSRNYLELSKYLKTDLKDFKKKITNKPNTMRSLGQNILLKTSKIVEDFLNDKIIC